MNIVGTAVLGLLAVMLVIGLVVGFVKLFTADGR